MAKIKLADYIIDFYAKIGVDKIFVVYGAANGDLIDAFSRNKKTNYVAVLHEQAGGFAAEGYAKVKGNKIPGVAIATSGPGGMNLVTPAGNCFYDSVPAIFITGQVNSNFLRPDPSVRQIGFQEADMCSIFKSITKYTKLILDPNSIKYELEYSLYLAISGRPGPVLLDIPVDIQRAEIDPNKLNGFKIPSSDINSISSNNTVKWRYLGPIIPDGNDGRTVATNGQWNNLASSTSTIYVTLLGAKPGDSDWDNTGNVLRKIEWEVTDMTQLSTSGIQEIMVKDKYGPIIDTSGITITYTEQLATSNDSTTSVDIEIPRVEDNIDGWLDSINWSISPSTSTHTSGSVSTGGNSPTRPTLTIDNLSPNQGLYTVTWTAQDSAGNSNENALVTQITIEDQIAPTIEWNLYSGAQQSLLLSSNNTPILNLVNKTNEGTLVAATLTDNGSGIDTKTATFSHSSADVSAFVWGDIETAANFNFPFGETTITLTVTDNIGNTASTSRIVDSKFGWLTESNSSSSNVYDDYTTSLYNLFDSTGTTFKQFPDASYEDRNGISSPHYVLTDGGMSYDSNGLKIMGEWIQFNNITNSTEFQGIPPSYKTYYGQNIRLWSINIIGATSPSYPYMITVLGSNTENMNDTSSQANILTRVTGMIWKQDTNNAEKGNWKSPTLNLGTTQEYNYYRVIIEKIHGDSSNPLDRTPKISFIEFVEEVNADYITVSSVSSDITTPEKVVTDDGNYWQTHTFNSGETYPHDSPYDSTGTIRSEIIDSMYTIQEIYRSYVGSSHYDGHWIQVNKDSTVKDVQVGTISINGDNYGVNLAIQCNSDSIFSKVAIIGSNDNNILKYCVTDKII